MKAKQVPRIRLEGRTDLTKAIPLDTPIHLFIDPSSACNFNCKFCFSHKDAYHNIMKLPLFKKIIDDCKGFPNKIKALRLYGFGDPLMNKHLPEMVRYAKESGVTGFVEFTTNGWWLNPELNRKLVFAGLDAITVSIPAMSVAKIREVCGKEVNFREYVSNIRDFYNNRGDCRVHIKLTNYNLTQNDKWQFHRIFGNIADEISIDNVVPIWPDMDNISKPKENGKNIYMRPLRPVEVCPYTHYHMTIHANGQTSTCFVDWAHKNIIGDVNSESLVDIWNGEKLRTIRINQLEGKNVGICINCQQLKFGMADNLDEHRKEILERLK